MSRKQEDTRWLPWIHPRHYILVCSTFIKEEELVLNSPPNRTSILVRNYHNLPSLVVSLWSLYSWFVNVRSLRCFYDNYYCHLNDFYVPSHADRRTQGGILVTNPCVLQVLPKKRISCSWTSRWALSSWLGFIYNLTSLVVSPWSLYSWVVNLGSVRRV